MRKFLSTKRKQENEKVKKNSANVSTINDGLKACEKGQSERERERE